MEKRNVGRSGLEVSVLGLGCNNFGGRIDFEASRAVVHKALDLGVTLFDTADIYGGGGRSEEFLGRILGERRKDVVIATKFGKPMGEGRRGASRRYLLEAAEASLRRLKTDWIDLYFQHEPDPATPIEETLKTLDQLVRQGKVRYLGASNLPAWQVVEAQWTAREAGLEGFVSCQDEYSLLARGAEAELLPAMRRYGLGLLPYFPLAAGLLSGKYTRNAPLPPGTRITASSDYYRKYWTDGNWRIVEALGVFCAERGHGLLELALAWLSAHGEVASVIAGATKPEQLEQNLGAIAWKLTADELAEADRLSTRS